ncbi:uncharacterized protein [Saccopteryx bilineata]|uniref:uncharacterized protein n=1 Tax=Saccopteryx bilineata TaxID=59482 RepID=UPI00338D4565
MGAAGGGLQEARGGLGTARSPREQEQQEEELAQRPRAPSKPSRRLEPEANNPGWPAVERWPIGSCRPNRETAGRLAVCAWGCVPALRTRGPARALLSAVCAAACPAGALARKLTSKAAAPRGRLKPLPPSNQMGARESTGFLCCGLHCLYPNKPSSQATGRKRLRFSCTQPHRPRAGRTVPPVLGRLQSDLRGRLDCRRPWVRRPLAAAQSLAAPYLPALQQCAGPSPPAVKMKANSAALEARTCFDASLQQRFGGGFRRTARKRRGGRCRKLGAAEVARGETLGKKVPALPYFSTTGPSP